VSTGPYSENPGIPTAEELGVYCPHGVKIVEPVSAIQDETVFEIVDPWPCTRVGCTPERFEQEMIAAAQDGGETMLPGR
jgi:hypothetical protein